MRYSFVGHVSVVYIWSRMCFSVQNGILARHFPNLVSLLYFGNDARFYQHDEIVFFEKKTVFTESSQSYRYTLPLRRF